MLSRETQALMEVALDAVIVIDHRGRMESINEAAERIFGYRIDELLGENVGMLMVAPGRETHDDDPASRLRTGAVVARRKDGTSFSAHLGIARVADSTPARFVGLLHDTTAEQVNLAHDRLTRVASLTAMGELAAGVAHELNQPLTAIATYARACEHYLDMANPDYAELREAVREIGSEALRAAKIIDRMRQLVRGDEHDERVSTDINEIVDELRVLLAADARVYETRVGIVLAPHLPRVEANRAQLQQAILSLMRNAFEALADTPPGERYVELATVRNTSGDIEILVSDNGPGVSPAISDRLFHPFSTTKKSGTGLGLTISHTIARAHGGTISMRPVEPHGATFVLCLPCKEEGVQ